jgi:hypothetical protein
MLAVYCMYTLHRDPPLYPATEASGSPNRHFVSPSLKRLFSPSTRLRRENVSQVPPALVRSFVASHEWFMIQRIHYQLKRMTL